MALIIIKGGLQLGYSRVGRTTSITQLEATDEILLCNRSSRQGISHLIIDDKDTTHFRDTLPNQLDYFLSYLNKFTPTPAVAPEAIFNWY